MKVIRLFFILIAGLVLTTTASALTSRCKAEKKLIDTQIKPLLGKVVGLSVGVYKLGKGACYFNYGTVRKDSSTKPTNKTIYNIASVSKVFTRTILSLYAEKNWLDIYAPVKANLPSGFKLTAQTSKLTYQQLATFTAGLFSEPPGFKLYNPPSQHEFIQAINRYTPKKPIPGEKYLPALRQYSNVSVGLLGQILMHIATSKTNVSYPFTSQGYSHWVHDSLTNKLNMQTITANPKAPTAGTYRYNDKTQRIISTKPEPWFVGDFAAGALNSNTRSLIQFVHANLCASYPSKYDCNKYPSNTMKAMKRAQRIEHYTPKGTMKDSQIYILDSHYKLLKLYKPYLVQTLAWLYSPTKDIYWKSGSSTGSSVWVGISPSKKVGIVILANTRVNDEVKFAGLAALSKLE